uniref:Uncharacterized protein n=1 Tax=Anopheles atroparvus TaxID=41427 RepID=A0AAG5DSF8_ANOAO
ECSIRRQCYNNAIESCRFVWPLNLRHLCECYRLGSVTTLEAFRHNPTDVASYQSPVGLVLSHRSVPVVPLVLHRNSIKAASLCTPVG